jgi:hypothetical protein
MTEVGMARKSPSVKRYVVRLEPEEVSAWRGYSARASTGRRF